jgi:hypothetical protein
LSEGSFFLLVSIGSILAIAVSVGDINLRYFCLPLVFFSCFVSMIISDISAKASGMLGQAFEKSVKLAKNDDRVSRFAYLALYACISSAIAYAGFRGILARRPYWKTASTIEWNIVETTENFSIAGAGQSFPGQKIYLLNIPKFFRSERYGLFYVASNSLMEDLRHRLGEKSKQIELISNTPVLEIVAHGQRLGCGVMAKKKSMDAREIMRLLEDGHIVLRFSPSAMTLVPLHSVQQE